MAAPEKLLAAQETNKSLICLGLDLDPKKMPGDFGNSSKGMFEFAHRVIDATSDQVCAYKPNLAFFESLGSEGISLLRLLIERIPPAIPVIVDGKRGDIANTAAAYAQFIFDYLKGDWATVNPYMGQDSLTPFTSYKDKGIFALCLTSNPGSKDFQHLPVDGRPLYQVVAEKIAAWDVNKNSGLVVGATHPEQLREIRLLAREMPLLIPGVGAQGGSLQDAAIFGTDGFRLPAVINVSRSVLYASNDKDFAARARGELIMLNNQVAAFRKGEVSEVAG